MYILKRYICRKKYKKLRKIYDFYGMKRCLLKLDIHMFPDGMIRELWCLPSLRSHLQSIQGEPAGHFCVELIKK